jgi:hypothetical protein
MTDKELIRSGADAFTDSCEDADEVIFDIFAHDEAATELFSQLFVVRVAQARGMSKPDLISALEEIWDTTAAETPGTGMAN